MMTYGVVLGTFLGGLVVGAALVTAAFRRVLIDALEQDQELSARVAEVERLRAQRCRQTDGLRIPPRGGSSTAPPRPVLDDINAVRARLLSHNIDRGITCRVYSPCGDRWQAEALRKYGARRNGEEVTAVLATEFGRTELEAASKLLATLDSLPATSDQEAKA